MASLGPSPPKRLKITPPDHSQKKPSSPSKLPVRNGSNIRATKPLYSSPAKTAAPGPNGMKLNFNGPRFRRAGGPRLSQSPARRSTFFEAGPGNVPKMGALKDQSASSTEGEEEEQSSPVQQSRVQKAEENGQKQAEKAEQAEQEAARKTAKRRRSISSAEEKETARINTEKEALHKMLEARVHALRLEVEDLQGEVQKEEARVEKEAAEVPALEGDLESLINRLLSRNDSSHTALPKLTPAIVEPEIPSARPLTLPDPLAHLSAFHCITFTSTSTTTITTPESTPDATLTQQHTAAGFTSTRLLFFTLTFTVSHPTQTVTHLAAQISPWARLELTPTLTEAVNTGNINTLLYALSSYTMLAKKRAAVFARLSRAFPDLLPVLTRPGTGAGVARRELVPWLGVAVLRFQDRKVKGGVELVLSWGIEGGVGGEAESRVSADVRVPVQWTEVDEMGALGKVGSVFGALVKERGVFEAARGVVGLLFQQSVN